MMILKNCTFYNDEFKKELSDIKIQDGKIAEIGSFDDAGIDMSGKIILPGFIDIHIHGGGGGDFCDASDSSLDAITKYLAKNGITSCLATTMTLPIERLEEIANKISSFKSSGAKIVGINFEGPFIAMSKKGAQNGNYVQATNVESIDRLKAASNGLMKIITIAPEASDTDEFINTVKNYCTVAIGHSQANEEECQRAIDLGVSHATHLYNAMTPMTHRNAGIVGTVLDNKNVSCELICDLEHICPTVLRNTFKLLGKNRAVAISDSMRGAGLGIGEFELGGQQVFVKEGYRVARLEDGTIAASISNLFQEFKNLIEIGIDFEAALRSVTINPARVIKMDNHIGSIAVGKYADLIVCNENLEIQEVYINGILA